MKLETKKNQKQSKFHLIDPEEVVATKEEWRVTGCSTDMPKNGGETVRFLFWILVRGGI